MVIVVDEYGNTAGLATMEDLLEVIIGEIRDEHEPDSDVIEDGQGGYIVSGNFDLAAQRSVRRSARKKISNPPRSAAWSPSGSAASRSPARSWSATASASKCSPVTSCASNRCASASRKR